MMEYIPEISYSNFTATITLICVVSTFRIQLKDRKVSQQTKALITAHLSSPESGGRKLLIRNEGNEKAVNIVVHKVIEDDDWLWHCLPTQDDPYGYLEPSQMFEARCSLVLSSKPRSEVNITWEDSNGPNETQMILSL